MLLVTFLLSFSYVPVRDTSFSQNVKKAGGIFSPLFPVFFLPPVLLLLARLHGVELVKIVLLSSPTFGIMSRTASRAAKYDYLIKLLLIGDSGKQSNLVFFLYPK